VFSRYLALRCVGKRLRCDCLRHYHIDCFLRVYNHFLIHYLPGKNSFRRFLSELLARQRVGQFTDYQKYLSTVGKYFHTFVPSQRRVPFFFFQHIDVEIVTLVLVATLQIFVTLSFGKNKDCFFFSQPSVLLF